MSRAINVAIIKKDTAAARRTHLAAMYAANDKSLARSSNDMDDPMTLLGERTRTVGETMATGTVVGESAGKRPRGEALEIAMAVDSEVVKEHAQ